MGVNKKRVLIVASIAALGVILVGAVVAWKYKRGARAGALAASIKRYLNEGKFDNARLEAGKLIHLEPENAVAHLLNAKALLAGKDPAVVRTTDADNLSAVKELLVAVKHDPSLIEAQRMAVAYYVGQRNFKDAMPNAQEILRTAADDAQANFVMSRALIELKRPLEARKHLDALLAQPNPPPRIAVLAAALGDETRDKDSKEFCGQADELLSRYTSQPTRWDAVEDRIAMVELRTWKAHRAKSPAVVKEHIGAAIDELAQLVKDERQNDQLPSFVLEAAGQLIPRPSAQPAALAPAYKELAKAVDKLTTDIFDMAVERKVLDPRIYTSFAERLREQGESRADDAVKVVRQGLENAKSASELVRKEFGVCDVWLAKHFLTLKQNEKANPHIEALLSQAEWAPWGQLLKGYKLVQEGNKWDEASKCLTEAVAKLPENGAANALYGLCMLRRGFVTVGRQSLEKGKALGADGPQFRAWLALALAEAGDTDKAIQMAQEILGDERTRAVGKALLGELRLRIGQVKEAEADFAASIDTVDQRLRPAIRIAQAQAAIANKKWDAAQTILNEVKLDKDFAYRAYAIEAEYYRQNRAPEKADEALAEGRRRVPDNGLLLALQVSTMADAGRFPAVFKLLQEARQKYPDKPLPYLLQSEVYDKANMPDLAITVLEEALRQFPAEGSLKLRLIDKLLSRNKLAEASTMLADVEGSADVNPSSTAYLKTRLYELRGDKVNAEKTIHTAMDRDKDNPSLKFYDATIQAGQGNFKLAAQLFRESLKAGNYRQQTLRALFEVLLCDGQIGDASALLTEFERTGHAEHVPPLRRQLLRLLAQREQKTDVERELAFMEKNKPTDRDVALAVSLRQSMHQEEAAAQIVEKALKEQPNNSLLQEVSIALMLDRKQYREATQKLTELFQNPEHRRNPTLHTLRVRAQIAEGDLVVAEKLCDDALSEQNCPGNPGLVALKVQLLIRLNRADEAASFATAAKQKNAKLPAPKYLMARAYEALGQADRAFDLLGEAAQADPSDANTAHHYLRLLIARGQFGDLEPTIQRFIDANAAREKKQNPLLLGVLTEYHAAKKDLVKAEAALRLLEQTQEGGVIVPYLRGVIAFARNDLPTAEKSLQVAMADPVGHVPSTFMLAQIRAQQGKPDEALKYLAQIIRSPETPAAVPLMRAQLFVKTGKFIEAETACRDYLRLNSNARPFRQLLTQILMQRNGPSDKQEALDLAEISLKEGVENPLDFEVYLHVLFLNGKSDKALQVLTDQAVTKNDSQLILAGSRACFTSGNFRDAARYAKKLVNDEPVDPNLRREARLVLGDSLSRLAQDVESKRERDDQFEEAAKQYREVLRMSPGNPTAANNLAWTVGVHMGRPHRALEELRIALPNAININSRDFPPEVLDTVGVLHFQMEHLGDAQAFLEEAVSRKPQSVEAQMHLGEVYLKQERPDRARQCFERARKYDGPGEFKAKLDGLIKRT